ncbi:hypothetical protein DICPUDRAFT_78088 [Dictyostelium purpureum]|uniref:Uncharacterized protein n=1 Tax=Dictyostelium purpureum TaxID=5786 RepID=F0ZII9_DICPU|nr:uncharacterized protein DICPUDRAFT_78088 [Dictyostelium purpureum]EGC36233.1 hypothetical protein DICPUDRAFT_78088 [Dictyostelium purpureum]|eukprot:XP_003287242.1 hypothetical protein DICPUDRAFT_78088 [Dictyostelium purpureum]
MDLKRKNDKITNNNKNYTNNNNNNNNNKNNNNNNYYYNINNNNQLTPMLSNEIKNKKNNNNNNNNNNNKNNNNNNNNSINNNIYNYNKNSNNNNNNNNNNDKLISNKKYKSTDISSEFDNIYTSTNTPSLVFTSNKENNNPGEIAFWKIFKNKILFNKIFSNFKFKELFNYRDLKDSGHILTKFSNGEAIIRDMVKSGKFVFSDFKLELIISVITQDTKENREFYRQLFSIYYHQNVDYSSWVQTFVKYHNKIAFLEFFKIFKLDKSKISVKVTYFGKSIKKNLKMKEFVESNGVKVIETISVFDMITNFQYSQKLKWLISFILFCIDDNIQPKPKHIFIKELLFNSLDTIKSSTIYLNSTINEISQSKDKFLKEKTYYFLKYIYSIYAEKYKKPLSKPTSYHIYFRGKYKIERIYSDRREFVYPSNVPPTFIKSDEFIDFQIKLIKFLPISYIKGVVEEAIFSSNNLVPIDLMIKRKGGCLYGYLINHLRNITKTEILDHFFNKHQELMFIDDNILWIYTNSKVMGHFENLMKSISRKFIVLLHFPKSDLKNTPSKDFFERLERAIDNPTVYNFAYNSMHPQNSINRYKSYFVKLKYFNQDSAISLLDKHLKIYGISEYFDIETILKNKLNQSYKLIYWIFQDLSDGYIQSNLLNEELTIKSGINANNEKYEIKIKRFTSWEMLLYYCGRTKFLYQNLDLNSKLKEQIFLDLVFKFKVRVFLNLLKHLTYSDFNHEYVKGIIYSIADLSVVRIFKKPLNENQPFYLELSDSSYRILTKTPFRNPLAENFIGATHLISNNDLGDTKIVCYKYNTKKIKIILLN